MNVKSARKWLLTINNPVDNGFTHDRIKDVLSGYKNLTYWCMCDEIGENKTYHTHLFICKGSPIPFEQIKRSFPPAHIDPCKGTALQNRDYILKEGNYADTIKAETNLKDTFEEYGECPDERQGKRNDLVKLYDMIRDGKSDYEILEQNPNYMKNLEAISRTRDILKYEEYKNKMRDVYVEYRYGAPATGKTKSIYDKYGFDNVYRVTDYKHPWDNYHGQDVVVFEEFYSGNYRINDMLNFLDVYPIELPSRYHNKWACYTTVYINSNVPFAGQYINIQKEKDFKQTWKAFTRRIHVIRCFNADGSILNFNGYDDYLKRNEMWVPVNDQIELDFN